MQNLFSSNGPSYLRLKKAGEANYNKKTNRLEPGIWNKVLDSKNKKIFLTTSGGLKLAFDILKTDKKYKDYGIYSCPIWGQKYTDAGFEFL